jgi:hypothetical protein
MKASELLTLIDKYCQINNIENNYNLSKLNLFEYIIRNYSINNLELVVRIDDNRFVVAPIGVFTVDHTIYKRVLIIKLIRTELLEELLK